MRSAKSAAGGAAIGAIAPGTPEPVRLSVQPSGPFGVDDDRKKPRRQPSNKQPSRSLRRNSSPRPRRKPSNCKH